MPRNLIRLLNGPLARERPDPKPAVVDRDPGEFVQSVDVDQQSGRRQAEIQGRNKALAARQQPRLVAVLHQQIEHLIERCGADIRKGARLHGSPAPKGGLPSPLSGCCAIVFTGGGPTLPVGQGLSTGRAGDPGRVADLQGEAAMLAPARSGSV